MIGVVRVDVLRVDERRTFIRRGVVIQRNSAGIVGGAEVAVRTWGDARGVGSGKRGRLFLYRD